MIASFPEFSKLDIQHRAEVEAIVSKFEPYSDFNFISLFSWNNDGSTEISELDGNLVIKLPHYIKSTQVYSFLGLNNIDESLKKLLDKVKKLELVPEMVIKNIKNPEDFAINEDHDNHDYVYLVDEHANLPGQKFSGKRKKANSFAKRHEAKFIVEEVDLSSGEVAEKIRQIFDAWVDASQRPNEEAEQERIAINRLLAHAPHFDTIGLIISVNGQPAGFSIHELVGKNYAICHFHKTISHYGDIDIYLTSEAAKDLSKRQREFVNWEQDLGLAGLRQSKRSYQPVRLLKKYTVESA